MRRPRFHRWIRQEIIQITGIERFNLRALAASAQANRDEAHGAHSHPLEAGTVAPLNPAQTLAAALLLYAHENNCLDRLMRCVYDDELRVEYEKVERHLGARSVERLALRGTPMRSLPPAYCNLMESFEKAYYTPERVAAVKRDISAKARESLLRVGCSPTDIARDLGIDRANVSAFLSHGETHRLNLEDARKLAEYATCALENLQERSCDSSLDRSSDQLQDRPFENALDRSQSHSQGNDPVETPRLDLEGASKRSECAA